MKTSEKHVKSAKKVHKKLIKNDKIPYIERNL